MIRVQVPAGEAVELTFAHGERAYARYDSGNAALDVRVEAPRGRHLRFMWMPANVVHNVLEALWLQVVREG